MTHSEAVAALLPAMGIERMGVATSPEVRAEAELHVARCSDCWETICNAYEAVLGSSPEVDQQMRPLFGCESVQDELWRLAELNAAEIVERHPAMARHLAWCHACADRLSEFRAVEQLAASGAFEPQVSRVAAWRAAVGRGGETIQEAVERMVMKVREGVSDLVSVPPGFVLASPVAVRSTRQRGGVKGSGAEAGGHERIGLELGESGLSAEIVVSAAEGSAIQLRVRVLGSAAGDRAMEIRALGKDRDNLVYGETVRDDAVAASPSLRPGDYLLDIQLESSRLRFRIPFTIEGKA